MSEEKQLETLEDYKKAYEEEQYQNMLLSTRLSEAQALADEKDLSTADAAWLEHVRDHVPLLARSGAADLPAACRYCKCLKKWDDPAFRSRIVAWIAANAATCRRGSGGAGQAGGTSYAH